MRTRYFVETILGRPCDADGRTSLRGLRSRSCGRILSDIVHLCVVRISHVDETSIGLAYRRRTSVPHEPTLLLPVAAFGLAVVHISIQQITNGLPPLQVPWW